MQDLGSDVLVEVVDTGSPWVISRSIVVKAPAEQVFEILANPRRHPDFDGSGSVRGAVTGPERLSLGATFGMDMRLFVPYRISSQVKEFDEGRRIAWAHIGGHRGILRGCGCPSPFRGAS